MFCSLFATALFERAVANVLIAHSPMLIPVGDPMPTLTEFIGLLLLWSLAAVYCFGDSVSLFFFCSSIL